jgi:Xaa-Pro aminopeptidase
MLGAPFAAVSLLLFATLLPAQQALPTPAATLPKEEFRARRQALAKALVAAHPDRGVVVLLRGAGKAADMGPFVQAQDFLYLTGVSEPDLALLLVPGADGALSTDELLVPPFSRFAATWDGDFLAPGESSAQRTGFATCGNVRALTERLRALLGNDAHGKRPLLLTATEPMPRTGGTPRKAADTAKEIQKDPFDGRTSREDALVAALQKEFAGVEIRGLERTLGAMRAHKSPAEHRAAAPLRRRSPDSASPRRCAACDRATSSTSWRRRRASCSRCTGPAPTPMRRSSAAGRTAASCTTAHSRGSCADDLIVMDYAPTLHGYASDVTRTFPASGTFSPAQRKLVQDVHDIQQELVAMVKPGASLSAIGARCAELLVARGYQNDHGPCHHVGLAVHDPSVDVLAAGMVITVEPGAYLRDRPAWAAASRTRSW